MPVIRRGSNDAKFIRKRTVRAMRVEPSGRVSPTTAQFAWKVYDENPKATLGDFDGRFTIWQGAKNPAFWLTVENVHRALCGTSLHYNLSAEPIENCAVCGSGQLIRSDQPGFEATWQRVNGPKVQQIIELQRARTATEIPKGAPQDLVQNLVHAASLHVSGRPGVIQPFMQYLRDEHPIAYRYLISGLIEENACRQTTRS